MRIRTGALLTFTLLPTLTGLWSAWAARPEPPDRMAKRKLIDSLISNPVALVNVTAGDMPASPDILLLGKRSTKALERCLTDNADAGVRAMCAGMLGTLGDRSALASLHAALGDWEAEVRVEVVRALGKVPADKSVDPLVALLERKDEDPAVRQAILRTLGAIGHPKGVAALRRELARPRKELAQPGGDMRWTALRALWRCRHRFAPQVMVDEVLRALAPPKGKDEEIEAALAPNDAQLIREAISEASQLRSDRFLRPLLALIGNEDTQHRAIQALGLIGDRHAIAPLVSMLPRARNARLLNNLLFALQRLDEPTFWREIQRMASHKQAVLRMNSAFVLGDIRQPKALPLLERTLADPVDRIQQEAVRAIAKLAPRPEAVKLLEKAIANPNRSVRAIALDAVVQNGNEQSIPVLERLMRQPTPGPEDEMLVHAIYRLSGGKRADLVHDHLYQNPDEQVRRRAAILLGKSADARVRDYLIACFEMELCKLEEVETILRADKDPALAGHVLWMWLRGREELADLVGIMRPAGASGLAGNGLDLAVMRSQWPEAAQLSNLLGDLQDQTVRPRLQAAAGVPDRFRIHALVNLCRLGDNDAAAGLVREIDNSPIDWLPDVVDALHGLREPEARSRVAGELERRQAGREPPTALAAAAARLSWTPEAALPRLLAGLIATDVLERETAERYLRNDRTPRVDILLADRQAKERNPELKVRLRKLLDVRRGD